jgi:hypothetical protein
MKNIFKYTMLLTLFLISISLYSQESKLYKWTGQWESISGNCPYFCIQRKFIIERKGLPPITANLVLSHTTWNGSNIQFITLDRQYLWISEYHDVSRISSANSFIGRAYNQSEAIRVAMDDAVRSYLNEEAARIAEAEKKGASFSDNTNKKAITAGEQKAIDQKIAQYKKDQLRKILGLAEECISRKNYDAALFQVNRAFGVEKTTEVYEMEKKVKQLIKDRDEKAALEKSIADKKKQKEDALLREEKKKNKKPDKKILFAGNPGYKPYPNPYDNPDPDKPVYDRPSHWKDYPESIKYESALKKMYDDAVRSHDGYRLLQLADKRYTSGIRFAEMKEILPQVHAIAKFNRDPWLMFHMADFYRTVYRPDPEHKYLPQVPAVYLKEVYDISILRNEPAPLYELYLVEKTYDLIPELTDKDISKARYDMMQ